mmetsp:Transcript_20284/g.60604  ORF Transcript_20284/g.60604 Transcript_20284/m.60604 type:complete len:185 (-) Transcript_20284:92-646(-)
MAPAGPSVFFAAPPPPPSPSPSRSRSPSRSSSQEAPQVAQFVRTLFRLIEGPAAETLCGWSEDGRRLVFPDPTAFAETVCPQHFRHNKWTSFSRMLNMYDFRKVSQSPRGRQARTGRVPQQIFEHDHFFRGNERGLPLVLRRKRKKPGDVEDETTELRRRVKELEAQVRALKLENGRLRRGGAA